ncbi:MAG TPA: Ig-like domain-containing protein, partial [Candidatus Binatus sp.]|nr:Ig-like domain-containing protein [Candidatus Binatus sp.]
MPARALLTLSVAILGVAVYLTASGGIGPLVASLGNSFGSAFSRLIATPNPSPTAIVPTDAPIIAAPAQPYTNQATATLQINVPTAVVGTTATVRVYVALQGLAMTPIAEAPVGSTTQVDVLVNLTKGQNAFTATILQNGVESAHGPAVTIVLDQTAPKITISSPADGASITDTTVTIIGTTKASAALLVQNAANGASVSGAAGADGSFSLTLAVVQGANAITVRATDQAGNQGTATVNVTQGSSQMTARLSVLPAYISISKDTSLQLRVVVTDSTGAPLVGAGATFTLQIPGLQPISSTLTTDSSGRAVFTTPLVGTMKPGNGLATVLVTD